MEGAVLGIQAMILFSLDAFPQYDPHVIAF